MVLFRMFFDFSHSSIDLKIQFSIQWHLSNSSYTVLSARDKWVNGISVSRLGDTRAPSIKTAHASHVSIESRLDIHIYATWQCRHFFLILILFSFFRDDFLTFIFNTFTASDYKFRNTLCFMNIFSASEQTPLK